MYTLYGVQKSLSKGCVVVYSIIYRKIMYVTAMNYNRKTDVINMNILLMGGKISHIPNYLIIHRIFTIF